MVEINGPKPGEEWVKFPQKINDIAERLMGVQTESKPALELIERYNRPKVLIYADPPYVHDTRTTINHYKHEMTDDDHVKLLEALMKHTGPVLLSGYAHPLYDNMLQQWKRETRPAKAENGASRNEVLWINPIAAAQSKQMDLYDYNK